jgi:23S rRNA G2069 N7-methylase RlmK/C1962 C5-methylase RlmI
VTAAVTLLRPGGVLFVSSNKEDWSPADFTRVMLESVRAAGRNLIQHLHVPQPPDFPIHRDEPGYLKTLWCRVE